MNIGKLVGTVGLALSVAAAGWFLWDRFVAVNPPSLLTSAVARGNVEESVLATGTLKPVRLVAVGAQVSGRIVALKVGLGQSVKAGDLVAEIDSVTQDNALKTAEAALANVKAQRLEKQAQLALDEQTLARQKQMIEKRAVSQADYDSAAAAAAVTRAQIEALDALLAQGEVAIETAKANIGYTRITAPIDGTVLAIVSQEGQTVNATQSTPTIVILGQLGSMTVRAEISEADVVKVRPGQPVWFTIIGEPDRRYDAVLGSIEPAPESIRNDTSISTSTTSTTSTSSSEAIYYNGLFDIPNDDGRLRTYMTAQVHMVLGSATDVLVVPAAALGARDADGRYAVRVVGEDGQVSERRIEIGLNDKVTAEVRDGLAEGDIVVTGVAAAQTSGSSMGPGGPGGPMGF
jgi:macrolide-specific efflux system membrane fusion protein